MSNTIGQKINEALAKQNVKQKELAKEIGVKDNVVSYWCKGSRTPNTEQIIKISKFLNVSSDYLFGFTNSYTPLVSDDNKALRISCDYTGLTEETIKFFATNKLLNTDKAFYKTVIDFIEFFICKVNENPAFSIDLETLREDTTTYILCIEDILNDKNFHLISGDFKKDEKNEEIQDELYDKYYSLEDMRNVINACKYTLTKYINSVFDEFSVSDIGNCKYNDLIKLESELFKNYIY